MLWFDFIRDCFWFIRNSYAFICEYNALHIENIRYILFPVPYAKCAFICESFGFIRKRYAFIRECFSFIRNRYAFICETNALHIESTRFLRYACIWEMLFVFLIPRDTRCFVKVSCNVVKVTRLSANFFSYENEPIRYVQWKWYVTFVFWKRSVVKNYQPKDEHVYHNMSYIRLIAI